MKKFGQGLFVGILVTLLLVSGIALAVDNPIKLIIDGQEIIPDVTPQLINGRVLVPARFVAEALGAKVDWDQENRAVVITSIKDVVERPKAPTEPEKPESNKTIDGKWNNAPENSEWLEGFNINGNQGSSFTNKHVMGFLTEDNFYLEEGVLNDFLDSKGLHPVSPKYPEQDIWFNAWYFISLKDVPNIYFEYQSYNLILKSDTI